MQIFERKDWIEGQLRQQIDSYGQSLVYNLLADSGHPPPWLWTMEPDAPGCPNSKSTRFLPLFVASRILSKYGSFWRILKISLGFLIRLVKLLD